MVDPSPKDRCGKSAGLECSAMGNGVDPSGHAADDGHSGPCDFCGDFTRRSPAVTGRAPRSYDGHNEFRFCEHLLDVSLIKKQKRTDSDLLQSGRKERI